MEVFFNELSRNPIATDSLTAKAKLITLLGTLRELRKDGFNIMRTSHHFYTQELGPQYFYTTFLSDPSISRDLKILIKGVIRSPYIVDEDSYEAEVYILSSFSTLNQEGVEETPEGLASAYVFNSPSISLTGHPHWQRAYIPLTIKPDNDPDNSITKDIPNIHSALSVASESFRAWIQALSDSVQLNSEANIALVFPPDIFEFDPRAITDLISWYYDDKRFIDRIKELIDDITQNPFTGGKGHTKVLGGTGGRASKRIIGRDRIVYTYTREKITIHQCRGHYEDN
jgi:Txe/YoeB family toxin of toxin-antitoxin system